MAIAKTKPTKTETQQEFGIAGSINQAKTEKKKNGATRITVNYDVGFKNQVYIRGEGAGLCWAKGVPLKNVKADEWVWEPTESFTHCKFKVLINDRSYEAGENHQLLSGESKIYTPHF